MKSYWDGENWLEKESNNHFILFSLNGKLHRSDGPAIINFNKDGSVFNDLYFKNGKLHREDDPAAIEYHNNGSILKQFFYYNGTEFDPNLLPFEMPIDTEEKEFYMNLIYRE